MKQETIKNIKIALYLSSVEKLSYSQIAKKMKRPLGTIKRWMVSNLTIDLNDENLLKEVREILLKRIDEDFSIETNNKVLTCLHCEKEYKSKHKSKYYVLIDANKIIYSIKNIMLG